MRITNRLNLPEPFVAAATSEHEYTEGRYSVTDLLGGTCEAILKRRHADEIEDDVADRVWAIFGSAVHRILQDAQEAPEQLKENWIAHQLDGSLRGYWLSGIFDLYDDAMGTVTDYKTASVWKVQMGDFEDWRKQALMYCWLLQQIGFDARTGQIVALLKDHSIRKARTDKDYPQHPVFIISWRFTNADLKSIEDYIYRWFRQLSCMEDLPDDLLLTCSDSQRWHKPDKWAVMRAGQKRAVKLFDTEADAIEHADWLMNQASNKGKLCRVEHRRGEDTKCESYCSVAEFCPYVRRMREAAAAAPTLALAT